MTSVVSFSRSKIQDLTSLKQKSNTINDSHSLDYFYVFVELNNVKVDRRSPQLTP